MRQVEWTAAALADMASLDKVVAHRIKKAIERFAGFGAGDIKKLQDIDLPEYRLRVGDWRVRFNHYDGRVRILTVRNRREAYR